MLIPNRLVYPPVLADDLSGLLYRTIYGQYLNGDRPSSGWIEFHPTSQLTFLSARLSTQEPFRVPLDGDGYFEVDLLVTDSNSQVYPSGWCWSCTEHVHGGQTFWFLLPWDEAPISLTSISPLPQPPPIIGSGVGRAGPPGPPGPAGADGQDGAFTVWQTQVRPDPAVDPVSPGDLWFEVIP